MCKPPFWTLTDINNMLDMWTAENSIVMSLVCAWSLTHGMVHLLYMFTLQKHYQCPSWPLLYIVKPNVNVKTNGFRLRFLRLLSKIQSMYLNECVYFIYVLYFHYHHCFFLNFMSTYLKYLLFFYYFFTFNDSLKSSFWVEF